MDNNTPERSVCSNCGAEMQPDQKFCSRCGSQASLAPVAAPRKNICSNCGAEMQPDQKFCSRCGSQAGLAPVAAPRKNICSNCGNELQEGQKFCNRCGNQANLAAAPAGKTPGYVGVGGVPAAKKKKSKAPWIIIISLLLVIGLAVGAWFVFFAGGSDDDDDDDDRGSSQASNRDDDDGKSSNRDDDDKTPDRDDDDKTPGRDEGETAVTAPPTTEVRVEPVTLKVAAIETAYGYQVWVDVCAAFTETTGIKVELTTDKNLEDVLIGPMQNGEFPDVVHLATGRPAALTEQLIKVNGLYPLYSALNTTIPGEYYTPADKIPGGFTDNSICAPYGDGVTYLAPMFYSPCGLFYNAALFEEYGWEVPTTWDEMWELGDMALEQGIYLFTYPTAGYYDAFMYALMNAIGGPEFFNAITTYQEGTWDSENGQKLLEIIDKLAYYTHPSTPAQANNQDFTKNQQMVMDGRALFMPNGTWITGEMAAYAATLDNFEWGMTAVPSAGEAPYSFCWFEQAWIPMGAEHKAEAELFVAFLYSDVAAEIFASAGAMQPILGLSDMLWGENQMFYSIYDNGAKAAMGGFATFAEIPGVTVSDTFFAPINALVAGTMTIEEYEALVKANSALMRENMWR